MCFSGSDGSGGGGNKGGISGKIMRLKEVPKDFSGSLRKGVLTQHDCNIGYLETLRWV